MNTSEIRKENLINLYNEKGERHGSWESYYDTGQLSYKGNYVAGKPHGSWESYYDTGKLYYKGNYVASKPHGSWEVYYDTGQLSSKGNYVAGKEHGSWEWYHSNGQLEYIVYFDMGKRVDYNPDVQVELTLEEIAVKFNIPVERLKIKK